MSTHQWPVDEHRVVSYGYGNTLARVAIDERLVPLMEALRDVLAERRLSQAAVEERAGFTKRYLSRLMHGHVDMKLVHLYDVLAAVGEQPKDFFARLAEMNQQHLAARVAALERSTSAAADQPTQGEIEAALAELRRRRAEDEKIRTRPKGRGSKR